MEAAPFPILGEGAHACGQIRQVAHRLSIGPGISGGPR
jgi:hypothetical protein